MPSKRAPATPAHARVTEGVHTAHTGWAHVDGRDSSAAAHNRTLRGGASASTLALVPRASVRRDAPPLGRGGDGSRVPAVRLVHSGGRDVRSGWCSLAILSTLARKLCAVGAHPRTGATSPLRCSATARACPRVCASLKPRALWCRGWSLLHGSTTQTHGGVTNGPSLWTCALERHSGASGRFSLVEGDLSARRALSLRA